MRPAYPTDPAEGRCDADAFEVRDPRDGRVRARHRDATADDVRAAVDRARRQGAWWAAQGFAARRTYLDTWRRLMVNRSDELVELIRSETGKTPDDARLEAVLVAEHLHWAARNAHRVLRPRRVRPGLLMANHAAHVEHHPLGVVGVIGPWNYPAFIPLGPIAHALAAGNAVVFKPSEHTPAVGRWLADTFAEATAGHRVVEVVLGRGATGEALCRSGVDKLAFTGSTRTGRRVMAACADTLTPVLLECGGKDALLVDRDAAVAQAADAALWGAVANAGQTCVGVERVYVHEAVADAFLTELTTRAAALRTGPGPEADFGPLVTPDQPAVVARHIQDALDRGARAIVGGSHSVRGPFAAPVVLTDVPDTALAATDETFGPVVVVERVASMTEAVERANACAYGLGASVFSRRRGTELARRLRVGMVSVNSVLAFAAIPALPFGGTGASGFGRVHGAEGLKEFSRTQAVARRRFPLPVQPLSFDRPPWAMTALTRLVATVRGGRPGHPRPNAPAQEPR
ncbi:aldehyde dehydrogenase family protein [Streptomyces xanthochromogenes]|uniref:aldehyde dehydrogenase family protein n=1 Tax=Streptomyces xanthochromogenes TaxID=67384 RepID=UPI00342ACE78